MTVAASPPPLTINLLSGSALGPFSTVWPCAAASEVKVFIARDGVATEVVSNVTIAEPTPGVNAVNVTLGGAHLPDGGWVTGDQLILYRQTDVAQGVDFGVLERYSPLTTEQALDKLTRLAQEARREIDRAVKAPLGEAPIALPSLGVRAGYSAGWDAEGRFIPVASELPTANVTPFAETLLDDADAAAAAGTLGVFQTRTQAVASFIAATLMAITTMGYASAGDLGGAVYKRTGTPSAGVEYLTSADGAHWELTEAVCLPEMFGARGDLSEDTAPAQQAMFDHFNAKGGGEALFSQYYLLNTTVEIKCACAIEGRGGYGPGTDGGALIRTENTSDDIYQIRTGGAVIMKGLTIDAIVTRIDGAFIDVAGDDGDFPYNTDSCFAQIQMNRPHDGLRIRAAINWHATELKILDFRNVGVYLSGEGWAGTTGDETAGQSAVSNSVIHALNTTAVAQACVRYDCGGDFRIVSSKLLGSQYGLRLALTRGPTGTVMMGGGTSCEQQLAAHVFVEQITPDTEFANLSICNCQFSIITDDAMTAAGADPQATLLIANGTTSDTVAWVRNLTFVGNVINHAYIPSIARATIQLSGVWCATIDANAINFNGTSAHHFGFGTGANCHEVKIGRSNVVSGLTGAGRKFAALNSNTQIDDRDGIALAELQAVADGSEAMVTGVTSPSYGGSLSSGAVKCIARRLNGAWVAG